MAALLVTCGYVATQKEEGPAVCRSRYALCTSAQCIPDPLDSSKTICFCDILEGPSLGNLPCDERTPYTDNEGAEHVISTFSFEQLDRKQLMTCPDDTPWSNCLDQPCTADPQNPAKAICSCKLVRKGIWQTYGGNCDTDTCETGYWSGATVDGNSAYTKRLMQALGMQRSPIRFCPE